MVAPEFGPTPEPANTNTAFSADTTTTVVATGAAFARGTVLGLAAGSVVVPSLLLSQPPVFVARWNEHEWTTEDLPDRESPNPGFLPQVDPRIWPILQYYNSDQWLAGTGKTTISRELHDPAPRVRVNVAEEGDEPDFQEVPIYFVPKSVFPEVYQHDVNMIAAGAPVLVHVTFDPVIWRTNRRRATRGAPDPRPFGKHAHEYPHATTYEGGVAGSWALVDARQNELEGVYWGAFREYNNLQEGDAVLVVPVDDPFNLEDDLWPDHR
jgi:hypothetical protein